MNCLFPPREKNQELCAESETSNNNAMDSNNIQLCDSIWKYAIKLRKITITSMNLDVFLPKLRVCVLT